MRLLHRTEILQKLTASLDDVAFQRNCRGGRGPLVGRCRDALINAEQICCHAFHLENGSYKDETRLGMVRGGVRTREKMGKRVDTTSHRESEKDQMGTLEARNSESEKAEPQFFKSKKSFFTSLAHNAVKGSQTTDEQTESSASGRCQKNVLGKCNEVENDL